MQNDKTGKYNPYEFTTAYKSSPQNLFFNEQYVHKKLSTILIFIQTCDNKKEKLIDVLNLIRRLLINSTTTPAKLKKTGEVRKDLLRINFYNKYDEEASFAGSSSLDRRIEAATANILYKFFSNFYSCCVAYDPNSNNGISLFELFIHELKAQKKLLVMRDKNCMTLFNLLLKNYRTFCDDSDEYFDLAFIINELFSELEPLDLRTAILAENSYEKRNLLHLAAQAWYTTCEEIIKESISSDLLKELLCKKDTENNTFLDTFFSKLSTDIQNDIVENFGTYLKYLYDLLNVCYNKIADGLSGKEKAPLINYIEKIEGLMNNMSEPNETSRYINKIKEIKNNLEEANNNQLHLGTLN